MKLTTIARRLDEIEQHVATQPPQVRLDISRLSDEDMAAFTPFLERGRAVGYPEDEAAIEDFFRTTFTRDERQRIFECLLKMEVTV